MLNPHELMRKIEDYFANTSKEQIVAALHQAGYEFYKSINAGSFYCRGGVSFELSIHRNDPIEAIHAPIGFENLTYDMLDLSNGKFIAKSCNNDSYIIYKYKMAV